ncbi:MAG: tRNA (adenosine(37)-N6)-threonylcarbamoyltransferase complex ATPase subunit type 1 TsaE [Christensenellales bacterium]
MKNRYVSRNAAETFALGKKMGESLKDGDIIALHGSLGAGKTVLAKGIACGLGIEEQIVSPTYTLLKEYCGGRLALYHFDLYRIEEEEELWHIGFYDYLGADGVCIIEWAEKASDLPCCVCVSFEGSGSDLRIINIQGMEGSA